MEHEKFYIYKKTEGGNYYLFISRSLNGKRHFKKISCKTKNKTEALTFLKNYEKLEETLSATPHLKLSEIKKPIIDYATSNLCKASCDKYELTIRVLVNIIGDMEISQIQFKDIEYFKSVLIKKIKKETVNIYIRYIKAIWNLLVKFRYLVINSLTELKQFKIHEKEIISFSDNELDLIISNIPDQKIKSITILAAETGMRISELLNLKVKNIDFENELINITNNSEFNTKSRKNRIIPFNKIIKDIILICIEKYCQDKEKYLFRVRLNIPFKRDFISRYFRRILSKLSFDERYHFHCLRATFIMKLVRKGVNPIFIQKLSGHSTLSVTQKYCFVQIFDLRNAINTE